MSKPRKRFIAGATCPACQAVDSLQLTITGDHEQVHCVACNHQFESRDGQAAEQTSQPVEVAVPSHLIGIFKP